MPVYTTVQWDYYTAQHEPQWLQVAADGSIQGQKPYEAGFYAKLCLNTPYVDFLEAHVDEMFEQLPAVDGLFFDIVQDQGLLVYGLPAGDADAGHGPVVRGGAAGIRTGSDGPVQAGAVGARARAQPRLHDLLQLGPRRAAPERDARRVQPLGAGVAALGRAGAICTFRCRSATRARPAATAWA